MDGPLSWNMENSYLPPFEGGGGGAEEAICVPMTGTGGLERRLPTQTPHCSTGIKNQTWPLMVVVANQKSCAG